MKPITKLLKQLYEFREKTLRDDDIWDIKNVVIDYMNETQNRAFEEILYEFEDYDIIEDYVKSELERWWLERLYYCIRWWETRLNREWYKINAYWNVENIEWDDIENRLDELIEKAEEIKKEK